MKVFWTDGSAAPNPGEGGCVVIDAETKEPVFLAREESTTNIRMEGLAIYAAIKLADGEEAEIHSDSEFWKNVLEKWAPVWSKNDWKKKGGAIKNLRLVQSVYNEFINSKVKIIWVKGHAGVELNELCDEWANNARKDIGFGNLKPMVISTE